MIGRVAVARRRSAVLQGKLLSAPAVGPDAALHLQRTVVGARVAVTVLCKLRQTAVAAFSVTQLPLRNRTLCAAAPTILKWIKKPLSEEGGASDELIFQTELSQCRQLEI